MPRKRRTSTDEYQRQMIQLYNNGKSRDIVKEYELIVSALDRWIKQAIDLRKENQRLKMEVEILKQAALIMGRK